MRTLCRVGASYLLAASVIASASSFDGAGDFQTSDYGYYYAITGGLDPGDTYNGYSIGSGAGDINGDNATGGTMRFITDDPAWGYTIDTWHNDDWFTSTMSLALTLQDGNTIVYDNNGILSGDGSFYDGSGASDSGTVPGLYRGYSMSNNWDWVYAGMFILGEETTFDSITGFFDENSGFDRNDPNIMFQMNIWSATNTGGTTFVPVNTGGFEGDVLTTAVTGSSYASGTFTTFDTGINRIFGTDFGNMTDDIFGLTYDLDTQITLGPGVYFFSHDARIAPVPEPATITMLGMGLGAFALSRMRKRRG